MRWMTINEYRDNGQTMNDRRREMSSRDCLESVFDELKEKSVREEGSVAGWQRGD